jgi:hypothetical protein
MTKEQKARLIEAYSNKIITKKDMEFLLEVGTNIPPIEWVYKDQERKLRDERKRDLLRKVFDMRIPKIVWVKTDESDA